MRKTLRVAEASAFEALPVAAIVTDARGTILAANREARRLCGRRPRAGEACRAYWGCRLRPSRCPLKRAMDSGQLVRRAVVRGVGPRGPRVAIERVAPLRLPCGRRGATITMGTATAFLRRLKRLRLEAGTDPLTGVLSRRRFDALVARILRRERRRPSAFLMIDVDGLKAVNDRLGHAAGDRLLRRLGHVLREGTRRADVVGRVGGDEFAVYCPATTRSRAQALVRRLRRVIVEDNAAFAREPVLSVQFGLACAGCGRGAALRERADAQLCRRKRDNSLRRDVSRRET